MLLFLMIVMVLAQSEADPVDKLQEFQKLMQQKVKVPKKNMIEYDSSDIFSDGYTTEEILDSEPIQDDNNEELLQLQKQQEEEEQQLLELQRLKALEEEEKQRMEQKLIQEVKQKKKLIKLSEWSEDESSAEIQELIVPKRKHRKEVVEVVQEAPKKQRKQINEEIEQIIRKPQKKQRRVPTPPPPSESYDYDYQYDSDEIEKDEEFIQKVPVQNQTFIKFNNPNNKLELAPCSSNPVQQRACSLCKTEVGFQLDDDNWYLIGLQHGYKKEFLQLLEQTKRLFGESELFLSFSSSNQVCLTSESLHSNINLEEVLQYFGNRNLKHFMKNDLFGIPKELEGLSFQFRAQYVNKQFTFYDLEFKVKSNLMHELENSALLKVNSIEFLSNDVCQKYYYQSQMVMIGNANELGMEWRMKDGESQSELLVMNCQLPLHNELLLGLSDLYFGQYFKEALATKLKNQTFKGDLNASSINEEGKLRIKFALKKK